MKRFWVMFVVLSSLIGCLNGSTVMGSFANQDVEVEIRAAICEIENKNFNTAQLKLETILRKEPNNLYALRLLPGVAAMQIKQDDKSPGNFVLIRKAIDAYEKAAGNPVLKNEREYINSFIIDLYGLIGGDEKAIALLKKAENQSESLKQRAAYYTALAADNYACANNISDVAPVKSTIRRGGAEIYVFSKPKNLSDFERLKACAAKGSELIGKAIALNAASDVAWSYQASLFVQLGRIAEIEGKPAEKKRFMKEYEAAREMFFALSRKRSDEQARLADEKLSRSPNNGQSSWIPGFSQAELMQFTQELKTFRAERSIAQTVDQVYIPFELIVHPSDQDLSRLPEKDTTEPSLLDDEKQQRRWITFSPEGGGFSVDLPDNASVSMSGTSRIYTASGSGISFFILETALSKEVPEDLHDAALNVLAWTITNYLSGRSLQASRWNDRFESELMRKDKLNSLPARYYAYRITTCQEKQEGMMIFIIGKKNTYAIDIHGAGESDERVQRFLKSLKLN